MFHVEHDRRCENHSMDVGSAGRETERDVPRGTSTEDFGKPHGVPRGTIAPSDRPQVVELPAPIPGDPQPRETAVGSGESKLDPSTTIPLLS
jgi:hypothetical protein